MHRERHRGELESTEIICEVTIVHPRSGVGRHSLSFVVVVLRGVVIARERRESSCQYDRRTFVIVESFLLERVRVVGQFIEDSSKIYIM